jgi:hypothetical protein
VSFLVAVLPYLGIYASKWHVVPGCVRRPQSNDAEAMALSTIECPSMDAFRRGPILFAMLLQLVLSSLFSAPSAVDV